MALGAPNPIATPSESLSQRRGTSRSAEVQEVPVRKQDSAFGPRPEIHRAGNLDVSGPRPEPCRRDPLTLTVTVLVTSLGRPCAQGSAFAVSVHQPLSR